MHGVPLCFNSELGLAVRGVAADQNDARTKLRPVLLNPRVNLGAIHRARHTYIGNHAEIFPVAKFFESFCAGRRVFDGISAPFERCTQETP